MACYWKAFHECNSSRSVGMSVGAIPLSEIVAYLNLHYITDIDERLEYTKWIMFLDQVYLKLNREKQEKETKNRPPGQQKQLPP